MTRPIYAPLAGFGILLGFALPGCGGGDDGGGGTPPPTTTIAKTATSGDLQSGTVGQPLANPLEVVVTEDGAPASGRTVTWATTASGGSIDPTSVATDADGVATTTWTLGTTSGSQSASATLSGATGSPVAFTASAAPDAPASLSKQSGDVQSAEVNTPLPAPVEAKVSDQFGNGVAGIDVGWSATGGTVSAPSVLSNNAGISAVNVTAGGADGPITITATADGLIGSPLTFNATATEPAPIPTSGAVTVGNDFFRSNRNNTSPAVDTVTVGGSVTWTWVNTGTIQHSVRSLGSPSFTSSTIEVAPASHSFTFTTAGTYQYDCAVHGAAMTGRVVVR